MAAKYLGETFDIHGGGIDNIFPHNDCEIAQSEAAHDKPFARYWMLVGSLNLEGVKMSKSLGNTLTVEEALEKYRPESLRLLVLSSHYSNPLDLSDEAIEAADKGLQRLWGAVTLTRSARRTADEGPISEEAEQEVATFKASFIEKMDDDFNAPAAIGVLQEMTRWVNTLINEGGPQSQGTLSAIDELYRELGGTILGIVPDEIGASGDGATEAELVELLIELRSRARQERNWAEADLIRDRLAEIGIVLEDRPDGTIWKRV
jgi:cysteinyl-tRNA synthetase